MAPNDSDAPQETFFHHRLYRTIEFLEDAILIVAAVWHLIYMMGMKEPPANVLFNRWMIAVFLFIVYFLTKRVEVVERSEVQRVAYIAFLVLLTSLAFVIGMSDFVMPLYVVIVAKAVLLLHGKNVGLMCAAICLMLSFSATTRALVHDPSIGLYKITLETFLPYFGFQLSIRARDTIILILVALVVQTLVKSRQQSMESERLSRELASMNADLERSRIAREIHDGVGNSLASLGVQLEVARKLYDKDPDKSAEALALAEDLARRSLRDVRSALNVMRVEHFDLNDAVASLATEIESGGRFKMETNLHVLSLQPALAYEIFRVIQESCINALKHSTGDKIALALHSINGILFVEIEDNGQGLNSETSSERKGFGLLGIRERIEALHGDVEITSPAGMGTKVKVKVPLDQTRAEFVHHNSTSNPDNGTPHPCETSHPNQGTSNMDKGKSHPGETSRQSNGTSHQNNESVGAEND